MMFFVLEHDRRTGETEVAEFDDLATGLARLKEREASKTDAVEVVFFMADSIDSLKRTHGRFFYSPAELGEQLALQVYEGLVHRVA